MNKHHKPGWYTSQLIPSLPKQVFDAVPSRLWGGFAYLLVIITGLLTVIVFPLPYWLLLFISLALGASFASMAFLGHEILHGTVVRKPLFQNFLGAVAFWPLSTGPELWRKWHNLSHHVHTQDEHQDPDAWPTFNRIMKIPIMRWAYLRLPHGIRAFTAFATLSLTFTVQSLSMSFLYLKKVKPRKRPVFWLQTIMPWTTWFGLLVWIGPLHWLFVFLIPLIIANCIIMAYISTNHRLNPLLPVNDPLANSLSVTVPKWVDFLHFNFSHHTEHHLFPGMSSKYYPLVKNYIKKIWPDRYHEMSIWKALKTLWHTPRPYFDGTAFIEPRTGLVYSTLGYGLNPDKVRPQKQAVNKPYDES